LARKIANEAYLVKTVVEGGVCDEVLGVKPSGVGKVREVSVVLLGWSFL